MTGKRRGFQTEFERRRKTPDAAGFIFRHSTDRVSEDPYQRTSRKLSPKDLWMVRQELGLSREGLASVMNIVSAEVITRWETGEKPPTHQQLRILIKHIRRHSHRSAFLREITRRFKPKLDYYATH